MVQKTRRRCCIVFSPTLGEKKEKFTVCSLILPAQAVNGKFLAQDQTINNYYLLTKQFTASTFHILMLGRNSWPEFIDVSAVIFLILNIRKLLTLQLVYYS